MQGIGDPINPSPDWLRSQYLMCLGCKNRARNIIQRFETGQFLELRNGSPLPLVILIDKQEAAPEVTLKPPQDGAHVRFLEELRADCQQSFETYDESVEVGVARELARIGLPLSTYSAM